MTFQLRAHIRERLMSNKPGRNDPCPCGSGQKFKKCHGSLVAGAQPHTLDTQRAQDEIGAIIARHQAQEVQRRAQQGLGRPIISAEFKDHRFVAVGSTLHYSKSWKTFHDFLRDYPKIVLGKDWWMSEVAKPPEERHRILTWAVQSYEQAKAHEQQNGAGVGQPMTGAMSAYMRFAYDLYGLKHAVQVQELLIGRLKHPDNFPGAMYEVRVAAALLRAGFTLRMLDETDRRTTHVEFIATHEESGATYSVEAKRREGARLKINRQMYRALSKHSDHPRIVFIDINDERLELSRDGETPLVLVETSKLLQRYECDPLGKTLPPAYVLATWEMGEHHLDAVEDRSGVLLWGFHIEELHSGPTTLIQHVETRRHHAPIFALLQSMQKYRQIPVTFDGEASVYLKKAPESRLLVGQRMLVPGPEGTDVEATLESGTVVPPWKAAACVFASGDGARFIVNIPLTEEDLQAHAEHPETFFGVVDRNAGRPQPSDPLDWFDFLWESYSRSPKETLLKLMADAPDVEQLKELGQEDLATEYCARLAETLWHQHDLLKQRPLST